VVDVWYQDQKNPTQAPNGAALVLALSTGPPTSTTLSTTTTSLPNVNPRPVPNVVGMNPAQTSAAMHAADLYYQTFGPGSQNGTWTTVVSTVPTAGTVVPWHSTVRVNVR
jgi:beta-lactam-binding protein with PASTA domain